MNDASLRKEHLEARRQVTRSAAPKAWQGAIVGDNYESGAVGWRFFLWWVLTFLGFPLGGLLAFVTVGSVDGAASGALAGALAGAVIGGSQWLVLRRYLSMGVAWVLATASGVAIGDTVGALLTGAGTGIGDLLINGLVTGAAVGFLQWVLLRGRIRAANLWVPVVAATWPIGWTVTWAVGVDVERGYAVFGSTGALAFVAITGVAMLMLRRPPKVRDLPEEGQRT